MSVKADLTTTRAGAGLCHTPQAGSTVPGEENGTLIHRCFDEVVTRGDLAAAHEILTTDFVFDGPATGVHGPVNFVQSTGILRNALFPKTPGCVRIEHWPLGVELTVNKTVRYAFLEDGVLLP